MALELPLAEDPVVCLVIPIWIHTLMKNSKKLGPVTGEVL